MKTQLIRCKCNAIIAASHEPNCYTDVEWIMNLRQDVLNNGCTVEYTDDTKSFKFESCICENKDGDTQQWMMFTLVIIIYLMMCL